MKTTSVAQPQFCTVCRPSAGARGGGRRRANATRSPLCRARLRTARTLDANVCARKLSNSTFSTVFSDDFAAFDGNARLLVLLPESVGAYKSLGLYKEEAIAPNVRGALLIKTQMMLVFSAPFRLFHSATAIWSHFAAFIRQTIRITA